MNTQAFTKLLSRHLYPVLRADGFRGSGATLRRISGPLVHVFNVQGSSTGNRCYLNLGAHLSFLSPSCDWKPEKFLEYQCAFRSRIEPPTDQSLGWSYELGEANALAIVAAWESQGKPFFERYASYPNQFSRLVAEFVPEEAHPAVCLTMARIATQLGLQTNATSIAESGLRRVGAQATGLRHSLSQMLAGNNAS